MKELPYKHTTKKPIGYRFCTLLLGLSVSLSVSATSSRPAPVISLSDAVSLTLQQHPDLQALMSQQAVWQGRIQQAGIAERPQIGLTLEDAMGTGQQSGLKSMQSTLTFSWVLQQELLDNRVSAAKTEASKLALEQQIKALDLSAAVARQFVSILVKQQRLKLNQQAALQARDMVEATTKRANAGKSSVIEVQLAKAELRRRELAVEDVEHELTATQYQLAALWGKPGTAYQLSGDLLYTPAVPSVEQQLALLKQNPLLQQFANAQRIAQSQIELARIEAKPQWQFSTGIRRYETSDDFGFVAGVTIPWGSKDRNVGTIAALKAQQNVLAYQQVALMQAMDAQLYVLLQEMAHSQHVIETVRNDIVPTLEMAMIEAFSAFEKGQLSYIQYSNVRAELLSAQSQLLEAFESLHLQHIEIQRLTGTAISQ